MSVATMSCDFGYKAAWNNLHENKTITLAYSLCTFLTCRIITYYNIFENKLKSYYCSVILNTDVIQTKFRQDAVQSVVQFIL